MTYQSQFSLNWVYLTCGRVHGLGTLGVLTKVVYIHCQIIRNTVSCSILAELYTPLPFLVDSWFIPKVLVHFFHQESWYSPDLSWSNSLSIPMPFLIHSHTRNKVVLYMVLTGFLAEFENVACLVI